MPNDRPAPRAGRTPRPGLRGHLRRRLARGPVAYAEIVASYVPGYRLRAEPQFDDPSPVPRSSTPCSPQASGPAVRITYG